MPIERQRGYEAALTAAGLRVDPGLVLPGDFNEQSGPGGGRRSCSRAGTRFTRDLRGQRPDGLRRRLGLFRRGTAHARRRVAGRLRRRRGLALHGARR
ncbi:MAG: hypothetical protein MZV49_09350 [Rhodopseudomonas palustris]|nr:hypothetical protein [Rhodopseudomonas palustris]